MRQLPFYTHVCLIGIWTIVAFVLLVVPYDAFLNFIVHLLSLQNHREQFGTIFTNVVYQRVCVSMILIAVLHGFLLFFLLKNRSFRGIINTGLRTALNYPTWLLKQYQKLSKIEKVVFLPFILALVYQRFTLSYETSVVYDEAWTYLAFTSKNPLVAACFYPSSNNHILFSHLTQITKLLPTDILFNIRLASLIPNLFALITLFFCLRNYFRPISVWLAIVCLSISFPMNYYGFVARGYSFIVFFFVIGFFSLLQITENLQNNKAWFRLMISTAFGFYTIPVYLYPFITLFGFAGIYFLLTKNKNAFYKTVLYGFATSMLILLLYLPVFTISGLESVIANKYVSAIPFNEVLSGLEKHFTNTLRFFTGINNVLLTVFTLVIITVVSFLVSKGENRLAVFFAIFCIIITPILVLVHQIIPVERTWIYLLVPLTFLVGFLFNRFKWFIPLGALAFGYLIMLSFQFNKQANWYDEICEEDSPQGAYFSSHFHYVKASIADDTRMLTFLKFNQLLRNEDWNLQSKFGNEIPKNAYIIQYLRDEKKDSVPIHFAPLLDYKGYRLLIHAKP